mgnify:CR=1 FL=1
MDAATGEILWKTFTAPEGFSGNAVWGMQFIWPIKADYRIVYLDPDYRNTIIGRVKREYVWIMSREPQLADAEYQHLPERVQELGYDIDQLQRVPQRWEEQP